MTPTVGQFVVISNRVNDELEIARVVRCTPSLVIAIGVGGVGGGHRMKCTCCDNEAEPGERLCAQCQEIDWYALSNGLSTVMPDGTLVHGSDDE